MERKINKIPVSECFYSLQGEGITTGYPAVFLRLAGCNLMCGGQGTQFDKHLHNGATWRCDTIEVWMMGKATPFSEVFNQECIDALKNGAHLIITGGEPTLQQSTLKALFEYIETHIAKDVFIECETNGTIIPDVLSQRVNLFNCSPKLSNSGNPKDLRYNPQAIKFLNSKNTIFKFVISREQDWQEIRQDFLPLIDKDKIWLMPAGENQELLNQTKPQVAELAKKYYLKMTNRLHIEIWNKKTGV